MKKTFWIIGAVLAVLVIALIVILILGGNQYQPASDPECRFSYSYCTEGSTLLVKIEGDFDEGCVWTAEGYREGVLKVGKAEDKRGCTVFRVEPVGIGTSPISFRLGKEAGTLTDLRYEILISASVDDENKVEAAGSRYWEYGPLSVNGAGSAHPYTLAGAGNGASAILIGSSGEFAWKVVGEAKSLVRVETASDGEGGSVYRIAGIGTGEGTLILYDEKAGEKLTLTVNASDDGTAKILSHAMSAYDKNAESLDENERSFRETTGLTGLPAGADEVGWDWGEVDYGEGDGTKLAKLGTLSYTSDGKAFVLNAFSGMAEEDFLAYCFLTDRDRTETEIAGRKATVYDLGDGESAVSLKIGEDGALLRFRAYEPEGGDETVPQSELLAELARLLALIP